MSDDSIIVDTEDYGLFDLDSVTLITYSMNTSFRMTYTATYKYEAIVLNRFELKVL